MVMEYVNIFVIREGGSDMLGVMVVDKQRQMYAIYRNMLHWEQYGFEILTRV